MFTIAVAGYTVTVHADESMAGLYNNQAGTTLTINGSGAGTLDLVSGLQAFDCAGPVIINAPISGVGGVAPQFGGSLYLYGNNTYTGGTVLGTSGVTLSFINNNNSFGSGLITVAGTGYSAILATGGAAITLPNAFAITNAGSGVNFASAVNTPVRSTGHWNLQQTLMLKNGGDSTAPLTLSGTLSGPGGVTLSCASGGEITLSGANAYAGPTTLNSGILTLGAANTIASSSKVILNGGTMDPGGLSQAMVSTALALTANSTIDFGAGASEVDFANSAAAAWTAGKVLNLANWDPSKNELRFGTDATGLAAGQLAAIEFNGTGLGTAQLDSNGYLVVPEPTTPLLGQPARLSSNLCQFQLAGSTGQNYTVQVSTSLASSNWFTLLITNLLASPVLIQDNQATNQARFYRVLGP